MRRLDAAEIHASLAGRWSEVLVRLGIGEEHLRNKHGPCPACGGRDRFRFDDKDGRGTWICSHCGAGDGFALLTNVNNWTFAQARRAVVEAMGLREDVSQIAHRSHLHTPKSNDHTQPNTLVAARPTARVLTLLRTSTTPELVQDAVDYLASRHLWPLPAGCTLRAHAGAEYYEDRELVGRFPALLAEVTDHSGERITAHVTYLRHGRKLDTHAPRKILSSMAGRNGCAVRLMPAGETLGIAEGIETALAAHRLHHVPTWAALNTALLAKFEPPAEVKRLIIFADRDVPGLEAAWHLRDRLSIACELRVPSEGDWADMLAGGAQ